MDEQALTEFIRNRHHQLLLAWLTVQGRDPAGPFSLEDMLDAWEQGGQQMLEDS